MSKEQLLTEFRKQMADCLESMPNSIKENKGKATEALYKRANMIKEKCIKQALSAIENSVEMQLKQVLLITYVSFIAILEYRNLVWPYEKLDFSRRIGELWELMFKLPFYYPLNELNIYTPPSIDVVEDILMKKISDFVNNLNISKANKNTLLRYYKSIWAIIDDGDINLKLDLHFELNEEYYDIDYKSGFGSNEKGNKNRILLVARLYKSLPETHNLVMLIRQEESENNNYLQVLKKSGLWDVYCADEAYEKIHEFTGFDVKKWMNDNMDWLNDISPEFMKHLSDNDLITYLKW